MGRYIGIMLAFGFGAWGDFPDDGEYMEIETVMIWGFVQFSRLGCSSVRYPNTRCPMVISTCSTPKSRTPNSNP